MHATKGSDKEAMSKLKALSATFVRAICPRVVSYYAVGILYDWHVFTWYVDAVYPNWKYSSHLGSISGAVTLIRHSILKFGPGILNGPLCSIGLNSAISMFAGSFLAWGLIGPFLVHYGACIGKQEYPVDPKWSPLVSFISLKHIGEGTPSPRYWLLWP